MAQSHFLPQWLCDCVVPASGVIVTRVRFSAIALVKAVFAILGYVIASVIAGVVASFIFDILPLRGISVPLFYTVWLVAGVFCGLLGYNAAGSMLSPKTDQDWSASPDSGKYGLVVIVLAALVIAALWIACVKFAWTGAGADDHYVPDNQAMSITYFVGMLGAMIGGHAFLRPTTGTKDKQPGSSNHFGDSNLS